MSLAILEQVAEQSALSTEQARSDYKSLLARANNPKPADAKLLARTLDALKLTAKNFEADAAALLAMPGIEGRRVSADDLETGRLAVEAAKKDMEAAEVALKQAKQKWLDAHTAWNGLKDRNNFANEDAHKLRRDHPRVFSEVWPEPKPAQVPPAPAPQSMMPMPPGLTGSAPWFNEPSPNATPPANPQSMMPRF